MELIATLDKQKGTQIRQPFGTNVHNRVSLSFYRTDYFSLSLTHTHTHFLSLTHTIFKPRSLFLQLDNQMPYLTNKLFDCMHALQGGPLKVF